MLLLHLNLIPPSRVGSALSPHSPQLSLTNPLLLGPLLHATLLAPSPQRHLASVSLQYLRHPLLLGAVGVFFMWQVCLFAMSLRVCVAMHQVTRLR